MCQQHQVILILKANNKEADDEHVENEEEEGDEEEREMRKLNLKVTSVELPLRSSME